MPGVVYHRITNRLEDDPPLARESQAGAVWTALAFQAGLRGFDPLHPLSKPVQSMGP